MTGWRWLVCLVLLAPLPARAQEQYYGTVATSVALEPHNDADFERIAIRPGDTITPENVRDSIAALYATERYRNIEVQAARQEAGTALTFHVTAHYFFSTFRLEPEALLGRGLSSALRIPIGEKFSTTPVRNIIQEATRILEDAGYFDAVVTPEYVFDESQLVSVTLRATVRERARIASIDVQGGEATFREEGELEKLLKIRPGDHFSAEALSTGMGNIRREFTALGFLNTKVSATREYDPVRNTVNLTVRVEPGQFTYVEARDTTGSGLTIENEQLRLLVPVYEEGAYDPDLIREGQARIVEYLQQQGYFEAAVDDPEVIPAPFDDAVQINFFITPGERHRIGTVRIEGNTYFSTEELRRRMRIRPPGFMDRGLFSPSLLARDVAMIETLYRRAGFENVRVEKIQEDSPTHALDITINIIEGERYPIEKLTFTGNNDISEEELRRVLNIKEGDPYSPAEAENARNTLMTAYFARGYPEARVEATAERDPETNARTVTFEITEGPQYFIGRLMVAGNTRTADKIVRRYSGLREFQDPYNPEAILEAQQRLYATGLFNRVDIVPLNADTGQYRTMLIQVEDAKPILVSPGVGVKEYAGPRATLDVSHNNLFGLGRSLSLRTRIGVHERLFQTTYREPRLFNRELEGYGSLTVEKTDLRFFEARRFDFSLQILKRLTAQSVFLTTASYQTVNLQDFKYDPIFRRFPEQEQEGIIQIARLGAQYEADWRRDADGRPNVIDPQQGTFLTNRFEVASKVWGSEVNFVSFFNQIIHLKPVPSGVFAFSSRIGWKQPYGADDELPISERYFAGGSTTLRGFDLDEAGPRGGGQLMTIGNIEYRAPLNMLPSWFRRFSGAVFYDTGTVFERPSDFSLRDFTHNAGAGLRYNTPLGPIRFDVGFNLNPRLIVQPDGSQQREERVQFFFTLGHTF